MKVLIFLHGTIIMHASGKNKKPSERIDQVLDEKDKTIYDFDKYIPIENASETLNKWVENGIEIIYMSFHKEEINIKKDIEVLNKYNFPIATVLYRSRNQGYKDIVKNELPDIIIEDNCESIGKWIENKYKFLPNIFVRYLKIREMVYPNLPKAIKKDIQSIIVEEFKGIDDLNLDFYIKNYNGKLK